jgi:hypothetical protein
MVAPLIEHQIASGVVVPDSNPGVSESGASG